MDICVSSADRVGTKGGSYLARGFHVLDVLADTHRFPCLAEGLLDGFPRCNRRGGVALAEEVPAQEPSQVLDQTEGLVAADGSGHEAKVVRQRGVVRERVGNHFCGDVIIGGRGEVMGCVGIHEWRVVVEDGMEEVEE